MALADIRLLSSVRLATEAIVQQALESQLPAAMIYKSPTGSCSLNFS
jgi:hypothetical protein